MATRKIRLTLSGTQVSSVGPIIDVDFNGTNLDADHEVTAIAGTSTETREYTVDVDAGTYDLDIEFKNDIGSESADRNFYIDKVEFANDGVNYTQVILSDSNTSGNIQIDISGYVPNGSLNPSYDSNLTRTDRTSGGYVRYDDPGSNPKYQYDYVDPATLRSVVYTQGTGSIQILAV